MASTKRPSPIFPRLPPGRSGGGAERHRRERLIGAMIEAVARHDYAEVTITELVALAGISKRDFYRSFASKEECFWATYETILARCAERVGRTARSQEGFEERLRAIFEDFVEIVVSKRAESRLAIIESLSLGAAAVEPRARATALIEGLIHESLETRPSEGPISDVKVRAVVGGIRNIVYLALREGRPEGLREHGEELVQWGLGYQTEQQAAGRPSVGERLVAGGYSAPSGEWQGLAWEEPANSPRSRAELTQRERIMRGAAQVAVQRGYATLSIPAISAGAGVSNQTFYEQFGSPQEAFLAGFEAMTQETLETTAAAMLAHEGWLAGGAAAIATLMNCFVRRPLFRDLAFFQLPAAGTEALDKAEQLLEAFTYFLKPDQLPPEAKQRPPQVVIEAIAGGMWAVVEHEVAEGRADSLPNLATEIIDIVLVPFGVE